MQRAAWWPACWRASRHLSWNLAASADPQRGKHGVREDSDSQRMYANGEPASTIAEALGVSRANVYRVLADQGD
jgi:DNA invertase Pin-like site-specific DNA recombinase